MGSCLSGDKGPVQPKNGRTVSYRRPTVTSTEAIVADFPLIRQGGEISATAREKDTLKALYDFDGLQDGDLPFKKGDLLISLSRTDDDWIFCRHAGNGQEGNAPSNFLVQVNSRALEGQDWWFTLDRREADQQLMLHGNMEGTFLIRDSSDKSAYALSIKCRDASSNDFVIRHYKIRKKDNGQVYVAAKNSFDDLIDLVQFYKDEANGLACPLTKPCPRETVIVPFKDIEVPRESIQLENKLGSGNFGDVWRAKWKNKIPVAVKTLKEGQMSPEAFLEEAKIMHKLRHRKLVQLMGVCSTTSPIYIITEFMVNGALLDYLKQDNGRSITIHELVGMASQVADGMTYLEERNFIHRDLRAANILVGENNACKVADFGLARITENVEGEDVYICQTTKFPIKWTAPEAAYDRKFSTKSDVWSFGILLFELFTFGTQPYRGMTNGDALEKVSRGYRLPRPENCGEKLISCPNGIYEMMQKCWLKDPEFRPTFFSLKQMFDDSIDLDGHYRETG